MRALPVPGTPLAVSLLNKTGFEKGLTVFGRFSLITALAFSAIAAAVHASLHIFQDNIDDFSPNPHGIVQKTVRALNASCDLGLAVSFYVGLQGLILSLILNLGCYYVSGKSAFHYRELFNVID